MLDWLLTVVLALAVSFTLFFVIPEPKKPGLAWLLVILVLSPPTHGLLRRFSDERRHASPIPPSQEMGVGLLAALAALCSIGSIAVSILGRRWGWPMVQVGPMLMAFSVSALLSLGLGQAARHTAAGRWATRLTLGLLGLVVGVALAAVLGRALGHV